MSTESHVKLRKFTTREGEPIEDVLKRGVCELGGLGRKATIELRLIPATGSGAASVHTVVLTPTGASLHPKRLKNPTLVAMSTPETFYRIAEGSYSPVQAHLDGELKFLGDVDLAQLVLGPLAGAGLQPSLGVCPTLYNESYTPDGLSLGGTLTFSGEFFTPFGAVDINYDFGGFNSPPSHVYADAAGSFSISIPEVLCGPIPGRGGVGVFVTAVDLSTAKYTTQGYVLNCPSG